MSRLLEILLCFQILQNICFVCGLQSCGIFKHCLVGGFKLKSLNFSPLSIAFLVASIDWIFTVAGNLVVPSKIEIIGWLQQLKLFPVACNFVVFSNIVTYLVSSIIQIFPRGWKSCCIFKYGKILGGFKNFNFPPWPPILWYFQTLRNIWWLQ